MRTSKMIGWILSVILVVFLVGASARGKFVDWPGKAETFQKFGLTDDLVRKIGIVEVVIAALLLIPQTAFLSAILLTAYLGGAVMTHVRIGDPFTMPIIMGIVVWIALGLRDRRIFDMAFPMFFQQKEIQQNQTKPDTLRI